MSLRSLFIKLCFSVFVFFAPSAYAQDADADRLRATLQKFMDMQTQLNDEYARVVYEGELKIVPQGSYYTVTLPHLRYEYLDVMALDIGTIVMNAAPHNADQWKMSIATPTPFVVFQEDGTKMLELHIGGQNVAGVWDEGLMSFAKLDAKYSDITTKVDGEAVNVGIENISVRYDLDKSPEGLWTGPGYLVVKNINAGHTSEPGSVRIGEVRQDFSIDRYDPSTMEQFQSLMTRVQALSESNPVPQDADPEAWTEYQARSQKMQQESMSIGTEIMALFVKMANGFDNTLSVKDLEISTPSIMGNELDTFRLGNAFFSFDMNDIMTNAMRMGFGFGHGGFSMTPESPETADLAPTDLDFSIDFSNIPLQNFSELMSNTMAGGANNPNLAMGLMFQIPALMSQAGVQIDFKDNFIKNDVYHIAHNGGLKAEQTSIIGIAGQGSINAKGLDALLERIAQSVQTLPPEMAGSLLQAQGMIQQVKAFAGVQPGSDGQNMYVLNYELTPAGQFLVNGKDVSAMSSAKDTVQPEPLKKNEIAQ